MLKLRNLTRRQCTRRESRAPAVEIAGSLLDFAVFLQ